MYNMKHRLALIYEYTRQTKKEGKLKIDYYFAEDELQNFGIASAKFLRHNMIYNPSVGISSTKFSA